MILITDREYAEIVMRLSQLMAAQGTPIPRKRQDRITQCRRTHGMS